MREIKFRGKRVDNGEWVYGLLHYSYSNSSFMITKSNGWIPTYNNPDEGEATLYFEVIPETVGQFTGLTDKNGVEIYDGDVIGRIGFYNNVIFHNGVNFSSYPVNNPEMSFILKQSSIDEYDKVIGNIHDNPELLK